MNTQSNTWSVTAIARETPFVIQRFVAWHLALGADRIILFFDDPDDPCISMLAHLDRVTAIPCTAEFWHALGHSPQTRFTKRQNTACRHGYDMVTDGWILNVDADELLMVSGMDVGAFLKSFPATCRSVLIEPAEAVQIGDEAGETVFRAKTPRTVIRAAYGGLRTLMRRNDGLVGHNVGKSLIRAGQKDFWLRQHFGQLADGSSIIDHTIRPPDGAAILHFFSRGYADWRRKLDYRLTNRGFRPQMRAALEEARSKGETALHQIYAELHYLSPDQAKILEDAGCLFQFDLEMDRLIGEYFPNS